MSAGAVPSAWAGVDLYGPIVVGGYSTDSSQSDPNGFGAAIAGQTLTVLTFTEAEESDGTPIDLSQPEYNGETSLSGDVFSDQVWFGSPDYANANLLNSASRIGLIGSGGPFNDPDRYSIYPMPGLTGRLEIDFAGAKTAVPAVGVGLWVPPSGPAQTIRVYDRHGDEITTLFSDALGQDIPTPYTYSGPTGTFAFIGLVATSEEDWIGRVVIDSSQAIYEIQDVSFVPEPTAGLGAAAALLSVFGLAANRRRR